MVQYNSNGLTELRQYAYNNFSWLAVLNDAGTELLRWDLLNNTNVTVTSDASANPVQYTVTITGQDLIDAGYSLPQTLTDVELYQTSSATTAVGSDSIRDSSGTATNATLEAPNDQLESTFYQEIPPQ